MYFSNYKIPSIILLSASLISLITINTLKYFNEKETFNKINSNYKNLSSNQKTILNQLKLYPDNLSRGFSSEKKKKILLIIGGFRDTPSMWLMMEKYFKDNKIDYVIPRITGFGRTYFQFNIFWEDWVLSIMDEISILQNLYQEINILGFSTGCNIALYVSQFKWNCKINNLILSSPNLIANKGDQIFKNILTSYLGSKFFHLVYPICHRPYESRVKKTKDINSKKKNCFTIFYEKNFPTYGATEMWKFQDILPKTINCNNLIVVKPNNDKVIGDIDSQINLLYKTFGKNSKLINIPSNKDSEIKVGHNIFNSKDVILNDFFYQIKEYIN